MTSAATLHFVQMDAQVNRNAWRKHGTFGATWAFCSLLIMLFPAAIVSQSSAAQPAQTLDFGPTGHCQTSVSEPESCGGWQEAYIALHANIVAGKKCYELHTRRALSAKLLQQHSPQHVILQGVKHRGI